MRIYIDADASPVVDIVISTVAKFSIPVTLVKSFDHYSHVKYPDYVKTIYVESGADAADYKIIELANANDIIITQDYGLASLALSKNCIVLHHKGFQYTTNNINQLLQTRHLSSKARRAGQRTKGPKPFTDEDKKIFKERLHTLLLNVEKNI